MHVRYGVACSFYHIQWHKYYKQGYSRHLLISEPWLAVHDAGDIFALETD